MAGIVPVFILLHEGSIYAFLDLAVNLLDLPLSGGVRTPSHQRPFKVWFKFEVHLDQLFATRGSGQRSENLMVFLDELTGTRAKVHALQVLRKTLLSTENALPFFLLLHAPHSFRGELILLVLVTLLDVVEGVYQWYLKIGDSHLFIILLGPYRRFAGPPEEVQAGLSLNTFRLSP